jgi:transcriptional regulator with XRE-family HTH domain
MIATTVVDEIRRLLRQGGLSQRKIASQIGVSRGTVNAIALEKRPDSSAPWRHEHDGFVPPTGLPVRCPGCGGKVQMPCLLCYMRARKPREKAPQSSHVAKPAKATLVRRPHGSCECGDLHKV